MKNCLNHTVLCTSAILSLFTAASASAATIAVTLDDPTDVLNTDVVQLIEANNIGNTSGAATVNGIAFGTDQSSLGATGFSGDFGNGSGAIADLDLREVLSTLAGTVNGTPTTLTIDLGGDAVGKTFRLQTLVYVGTFAARNIQVTIEGEAGPNTAVPASTSQGVNFISTFVATDTTLNVSIDSDDDNPFLNGYVVHEIVPEPGSLALMSLGALCMLCRRRH